jgi:hypothetical protein
MADFCHGGTHEAFIEGANRAQSAILPECLDEYISSDNPVRAIDAFVETLNLSDLGFEGVHPEATGRPSYHPSTLLRIYIYGYLNHIQSSRRLERETRRNLELLDWSAQPRLQDDRGLPQRQRTCNPEGMCSLCRAMP